ncbi:MAG: hypothetical protein ACYTF3_03385 [Planctomycetota bacterium]
MMRLLLPLLLLAGCQTAAEPTNPILSEAVALPAGYAVEYYSGDGLGWNLRLDLREGGRFSCSWHGCVAGSSMVVEGAWSRDGETFLFTPTAAAREAFFTRYFDGKTARLASADGHSILIFADQEDFFARHGASTGSCFSQDAAREGVGLL